MTIFRRYKVAQYLLWGLAIGVFSLALQAIVKKGEAGGISDYRIGTMAKVGPGTLTPFYPPSPQEAQIPMSVFWMDRLPVTQSDYLKFLTEHPKWRRDRVSPLFADSQYLGAWRAPLQLGDGMKPTQPVTQVSWFAAKAYCEAQGKRLPTENEWEFAAAASETAPDGRYDTAWRQRVLAWYERPTAQVLPEVGKSAANYWGIYDLHGLIWEWVLDFNSTMVSADPRESGDAEKTKFCGAGSLTATDKDDYASFMRTAFRSSLEATYTTRSLGFRCAADVEVRGAK